MNTTSFRLCSIAVMASAVLLVTTIANAAAFSLKDTEGEYLDISYDGKIVARYMYAFDQSNEERKQQTIKPFLHIFDTKGEAPITNGPSGLYPHHRGIFIGFDQTRFEGNLYDFWHMDTNAYQVHSEFVDNSATDESAVVTSNVEWRDPEGKIVIDELRTMTFYKPGTPGMLVVDFTSKLNAPNGNVRLGGDPEHAGIQYRPANEVDTAKTTYSFPKADVNAHNERDLPWVGETYTLGEKEYSVIHFNHDDNPKNTLYSAYRNYGRFGAFFVTTVPEGETLTVQYRFLIKDGSMLPTEVINAYRKAFIEGENTFPALDEEGDKPWSIPAEQ